MAKINPQDEKYDGNQKTPQCQTGRKLLAAVGFERFKSSTNKPMLGIRFVCLLDRSDKGDEGNITFDNFTLTDAAMWRIVMLARGLNYNEPFDPELDEDIGQLLMSGYVDAELVSETFKGNTTVRPKEYMLAAEFDESPEWPAMIGEAEEQFKEYLTWRAANPRGDKGSGGSGGSSRGGKSGGNGGSGRRGNVPF